MFKVKWIHVLLLFQVIVSIVARTEVIEVKCTPNCVCDHFRNLRRATCNNRKLLYLKDNVPRRTEILEFTGNYLSTIRNDEFHNNELEALRVLNLSFNRISDIEIFAFEHMQQLEVIDLTGNALRYVLPEWFWSLKSLKELYMPKNNLAALGNAPLFDSPTLQILNMAQCQIPHLKEVHFSKLPSLKSLDISNNYFIEFKVSIIDHLQHLEFLNVQGNYISCFNLENIREYFYNNSIKLFDDCMEEEEEGDSEVEILQSTGNDILLRKKSKFEKMIVQEDKVPSKVDSSWRFEETITDDRGVIDEHECISENSDEFVLLKIIDKSSIVILGLAFLVTFILGLFSGCLCGHYAKRDRKRKTVKQIRNMRRSFNIIRNGSFNDREFLLL